MAARYLASFGDDLDKNLSAGIAALDSKMSADIRVKRLANLFNQRGASVSRSMVRIEVTE